MIWRHGVCVSHAIASLCRAHGWMEPHSWIYRRARGSGFCGLYVSATHWRLTPGNFVSPIKEQPTDDMEARGVCVTRNSKFVSCSRVDGTTQLDIMYEDLPVIRRTYHLALPKPHLLIRPQAQHPE
jgi:hypothetical protein